MTDVGARLGNIQWPAAWQPTQPVPCREPGNDPDLWDNNSSSSEGRRAVALCNECPLRAECLDAALWEEARTIGTSKEQRYLIRGGMGPNERDREHKARGLEYLCVDCHETPRGLRSAFCGPCVARHAAESDAARAAARRGVCVDCHNPCSQGSDRCRSCSTRNRWLEGETFGRHTA